MVINGNDADALMLNDQSGAGGTYTLDGTTVSAPNTGELTYGTIASLTLNSSSVASTINVNGTSVATTLNTGTGGNSVNVMATGSAHRLTINSGGSDTVDISNSGSVLGILGDGHRR